MPAFYQKFVYDLDQFFTLVDKSLTVRDFDVACGNESVINKIISVPKWLSALMVFLFSMWMLFVWLYCTQQ